MWKVTIDRDGCISCGACWSTCPDFYEENEEDGLSQVVAQYQTGGNPAEGMASDDLEECVKNGADDCPVEVIAVEEA
ncbi:MAG TPA: ferredoxin [Chloroflexi bacterium]|jgi:ferredoxin|nr:ferredoxin [Chloroflexota bacterium]